MSETTPVHKVDRAYGGFRFRLMVADASEDFSDQIDGIAINQDFVKVSGVSSESEIVEYMHGSDSSVNTSPGRVKYSNITLDRVYKGVDGLYKWRRNVESGVPDRRSIKIEMQNLMGEVIRSMILDMAWPCKWSMPDLDAGDSSPAIESIELAVVGVYEEIPAQNPEN